MLLGLISLSRLPAVKGWTGETMLHLRLALGLERGRYHVLRDVTLPTADGGSTQIDHIVVSRHGVFVIETKNYRGWIFGKPHDRVWTQKFHRRSHTFQNPLRQNYKHVRTLAELAALDDEALFSVIAFVGMAELKSAMPDNVTDLNGCLAYIRSKSAMLLSEQQVSRVLARIETGRLARSRKTSKAHRRHVQALVAGKRNTPAARPAAAPVPPAPSPAPVPTVIPVPPAPPAPLEPACPRCGGALGEYTYKTGPKAGHAFSGCAQFPVCDYRIEAAA